MTDTPSDNWTLPEEVGGEERLYELISDFYDRLFADPIIGFIFQGHDPERLVETQIEYLRARLGDEEVEYTGESIRASHENLPITVGHFDRRHEILKEVLDDWDVEGVAREEWLELDAALRDLVVRTGEKARDDYLDRNS
jgi:hemoglobin